MTTTAAALSAPAESPSVSAEFLTITIRGQLFGIPVLIVQDVLGAQRITKVPLAPAAIAGVLNLRGRIVTALDVRRCLELPPQDQGAEQMSVVVTQDDELFSLIIDSVGEVLSLERARMESIPPTLDPAWRAVSSGVFQLDHGLLVVLDVQKLIRAIAPGDLTEESTAIH